MRGLTGADRFPPAKLKTGRGPGPGKIVGTVSDAVPLILKSPLPDCRRCRQKI
jgi:hypothetical protein